MHINVGLHMNIYVGLTYLLGGDYKFDVSTEFFAVGDYWSKIEQLCQKGLFIKELIILYKSLSIYIYIYIYRNDLQIHVHHID